MVGPLVGKDIRLQRRHVVTTTWGAWKKKHPKTTVLSLNTGHRRDYGEGVAYRSYFATQRLMFTVPKLDDRLQNKDEVLALRNGDDQLAISAEFLSRSPVYQGRVGEQEFVVLTDKSGANRVYESRGVRFSSYDGTAARDDSGDEWQQTEAALKETPSGKTLQRLPAHRAFWFGWYAQYPRTRLIK